MPTDGGIPLPRLNVLGERTLLEQQMPPIRMNDDHVARVMQQCGIAVAEPAGSLPDTGTGSVVNIQQFLHGYP